MKTELDRIKRRLDLQGLLILIILLWMATKTLADDVEWAKIDRDTIHHFSWPYTYYFGFESVPKEERDELLRVLKFVIASTNRKVIVEEQFPTQVNRTLWRIDTRRLGWEEDFHHVAKRHPYGSRLVLRPDWFIQFILDSTLSGDLYHRLLFGEPVKSLDDFKTKLGAVRNEYTYAWVEDDSKVVLSKTRLLMTLPTKVRTSLWLTFDSENLVTATDPLDHLGRGLQYDVTEAIGAIPKASVSGQTLGLLQVYALSNSKGDIQVKAPASIASDYTHTRGVEIVNSVSCVVCHGKGLNEFSTNGLAELIRAGVPAYTDQPEAIQRFYLTNLEKMVRRHNEDYAAAVEMVTGKGPEWLSAAVKRVFLRYDAPVGLSRARLELGMEPALTGFGQARIAGLLQGQTIPRTVWEEAYDSVRSRSSSGR